MTFFNKKTQLRIWSEILNINSTIFANIEPLSCNFFNFKHANNDTLSLMEGKDFLISISDLPTGFYPQ